MIKYEKKINFQNIDQELINIFKKIESSKFPKGFLDFINYSVSELFVNIKEHSKAEIVWIKIDINMKNCFIEISDNGIGLRKSYLLKKIYPKDDFVAIEFALSGLSTKDSQERGFGLYSIKKLVSVLKGEMIVESGLARIIIKDNQTISQKIPKGFQGVKTILKTSIKAFDFYKAVE
ncbi:MAG: hypothetical protein A2V72_01280 [Candidatus Nealsonbacteria bacterium RBG_13_37_56]|uniref:Histidine kinase/HSP90-like ATPase domain-containing protein n=1 Tax=Candidatus Nealsonbacteria bacterium RBG_13_37_56 TaxID=1801661 RepID=A0A1G2DX08_9BACT|nr:MAG: hypothetical protein A2V72_01280 [Candidatus Nealsonbacteria bacterium RBG_13_37_56]